MASGRTHANASLICAAIAVPVGVVIFGPAGLLMSAGFASGVLLTPDLDLQQPKFSDHFIEKIGRRTFGNGCLAQILRGLWRVFWLPYAYAIPHRSWASHAPFLGTLLRVAYLSLVTFGMCGLFFRIVETPAFWIWFVGLAGSDLAHWLMDTKLFGTFS